MALGPLLISHMKTPGVRALGVFLWRALSVFLWKDLGALLCKPVSVGAVKRWAALLVLCGALPVWACTLPEALERESVRVSSVYDGDSVRLEDGRRIRLIGINAPERARDGQPEQPLAVEARRALQKRLGDGLVQLVYDRERRDHYGRTLGHLFTIDGQSLEAGLLHEGLGFHIAIPPNMALAACLAKAQRQAQTSGRGVWAKGVWPAREASAMVVEHTGFQRVRGTVKDLSRGGGSVWVELDGPIVLRFSEAAWADAELAVGHRIEVRGWVTSRAGSRAARRGFKPLVLSVPSSYAWEALER